MGGQQITMRAVNEAEAGQELRPSELVKRDARQGSEVADHVFEFPSGLTIHVTDNRLLRF
jgi:hypothetical protein